MSYSESARSVFKELNVLIDKAKSEIKSIGFSDRIDGLVKDESVFVEMTIDSIKASFQKALEDIKNKENDHFPSVEEPSFEEDGGFSENDEIDVDELIADSYNVGKSDEEKSQAIMSDLQEVFKLYAYMFIAIGQQLEIEKLLAKQTRTKNARKNLST